jgi:hypothetical protein
MKKLLCAAAVSVFAMVGSAIAAPVSVTVDLFASSDNTGNFVGSSIGVATLEYDSPIPGSAFGSLFAEGIPPGFDFSFTAFGQSFSDPNDGNSFLVFDPDNETLLGWSLAISELEAGSVQPINDPFVLGFSSAGNPFVGNLSAGTSTDFVMNVAINDLPKAAVIPVPASAVLLLSGLLGAGLIARRRK